MVYMKHSRPILVRSLCCKLCCQITHVQSVKKWIQYMLGNLCKLDYNRLIEDVHISDLLFINNLSEWVGTMEKNIQNALDSQAPLKKKQLPVWTRVPWYTHDLKQQKQTVRKREQIWRKYRAEHQWIALKMEREKIHCHDKKSKNPYAFLTVIEAGKDTKNCSVS